MNDYTVLYSKCPENDTEMEERVIRLGRGRKSSRREKHRDDVSRDPECRPMGIMQRSVQPELRIQMGQQQLCARQVPLLTGVEGACLPLPLPYTSCLSHSQPSPLLGHYLSKTQRPSVGLI